MDKTPAPSAEDVARARGIISTWAGGPYLDAAIAEALAAEREKVAGLRVALEEIEDKASGIAVGLAHGWGEDKPWRWPGEKMGEWLEHYARAAAEALGMIRAALAPEPAAQINQCDGCRAGIALEDGKHRMGEAGGYANWQACTRALYETPPAVATRIAPGAGWIAQEAAAQTSAPTSAESGGDTEGWGIGNYSETRKSAALAATPSAAAQGDHGEDCEAPDCPTCAAADARFDAAVAAAERPIVQAQASQIATRKSGSKP